MYNHQVIQNECNDIANTNVQINEDEDECEYNDINDELIMSGRKNAMI